jgi:hypothetical protein
MKRSVIFCGKIRTPYSFKNAVSGLLELRRRQEIDQIILSTWHEEVDQHSDLVTWLGENDVDIVGITPPPPSYDNNYFIQATQLQHGLRLVPDGAWVLKTRPDMRLTTEHIPSLFARVATARPLASGACFRRKVWVPYYEASAPFAISDQAFLGLRSDIAKLCHLDALPEVNGNFGRDVKNNTISAEIRRYLPVFLGSYPLFEGYYEAQAQFGGSKERRDRAIKYMIDEDIYLKWIASYFIIMHTHFIVGSSGFSGRVGLVRREVALEGGGIGLHGNDYHDNFVDPTLFLPNFQNTDDLGGVFCANGTWARNIISGDIVQDDGYIRLRQAYRQRPYCCDMKAHLADVAAFSGRLAATLD